MTQPDLTALGEQRHETCRYGHLSEWETLAGIYDGREIEIPYPLCVFPIQTPKRSDMMRSKMITPARDCAACQSHEAVPAQDWRKT